MVTHGLAGDDLEALVARVTARAVAAVLADPEVAVALRQAREASGGRLRVLR